IASDLEASRARGFVHHPLELRSLAYGNPIKIDPYHFNAESDLIESLLNRDISMISYPKIDSFLEEFSGKLAYINLVQSRINKANFDPEEIRLIEELFYDNSSPRPPKESNSEISDATIESFFPSHILVEDSESNMKEIDLFLATDDLMPLGIEYDDYDSEGDIHFLEELHSDDPLPLPENKSSNIDHHDDRHFLVLLRNHRMLRFSLILSPIRVF
nr:hypothetical protein [Tanacetum cinerariifolium]